MMLDQLEFLLSQVASHPTKPIMDFSLVTPSISKLLPDPVGDLNWDAFEGAIPHIFSKNALTFPGKTCVVESNDGNDRTFTYHQINRASNILANHLIKNGVKREDVIVLYSYRGVDLVVAVMGVLKAGATFSVIDPAYVFPTDTAAASTECVPFGR
jgi:L-2-aminoadipate reductase